MLQKVMNKQDNRNIKGLQLSWRILQSIHWSAQIKHMQMNKWQNPSCLYRQNTHTIVHVTGIRYKGKCKCYFYKFTLK